MGLAGTDRHSHALLDEQGGVPCSLGWLAVRGVLGPAATRFASAAQT